MEIRTKIPAETVVSAGSESQPFDYSSENRFNSAISSAQRDSSGVSRISGIFRKGGIHIFHFAYKANAPEDRLLKIGDFVLSLSMPYSAGVFFLVMKLKPPKIICHLFPSLIWEIDDPEGVFLTFDDGPSKNTRPILEILDNEQVPATFFVCAQDANEKYLPLVADIAAAGHQIALHSATHQYSKIYASTDAFWQDIRTLRQALEPYVDVAAIDWLRFPGGSTNTVSHRYGGNGIMKTLKAQAEDKGYHWIDWNVCAEDATASHPDAAQILRNIRRDADGQDTCVVLLHDTKATGQTVKALPDMIAYFREQGYNFCTVAQMDALQCETK